MDAPIPDIGVNPVTKARYWLPLIVILAALSAALLACGSQPTAVPPTPETIIITATPGPTPTPQIITATPRPTPPRFAITIGPPPTPETIIITATPGPTPTPPPPVVITATPGPTPTPQPRQVVVTGTGSKVVRFDAPPERMVVYDGAAVEMLFAIGEGHRIAGTHSYVTYPPETESIAKVGDAFNMDIEAIVALEPDLVYVFYDRFNADLERAGLKVLYIRSLTHGFTDVANQIRMWGAITGADDAAEAVASEFDARVAAVRQRMEQVDTTQAIYSHGFQWWTPGQNTLVNDVFELLKLENIATFEGYQQISPEEVVAANPGIIMGDPEAVTGEAALSELQAVKDGRIFNLSPGNSFSVAGPRFMDAVEEMAAWLYPDLFP